MKHILKSTQIVKSIINIAELSKWALGSTEMQQYAERSYLLPAHKKFAFLIEEDIKFNPFSTAKFCFEMHDKASIPFITKHFLLIKAKAEKVKKSQTPTDKGILTISI